MQGFEGYGRDNGGTGGPGGAETDPTMVGTVWLKKINGTNILYVGAGAIDNAKAAAANGEHIHVWGTHTNVGVLNKNSAGFTLNYFFWEGTNITFASAMLNQTANENTYIRGYGRFGAASFTKTAGNLILDFESVTLTATFSVQNGESYFKGRTISLTDGNAYTTELYNFKAGKVRVEVTEINGASFVLTNCSDTVISNTKFGIGSITLTNDDAGATTGNTTIDNCRINGAFVQTYKGTITLKDTRINGAVTGNGGLISGITPKVSMQNCLIKDGLTAAAMDVEILATCYARVDFDYTNVNMLAGSVANNGLVIYSGLIV